MTMDVRELVKAKARAARDAARTLALCPTKLKNDALGQMAHGLIEKTAALLEANRADVERARSRGAARAFLDRLALTETRLEEMAQGLREIAALPDPVGTVVEAWRRPSGIEISRVRIPRGGEGFVRWVAERSRIPVLKHDKGVVHVFVDASADPAMAAQIVLNAKAQRPSVCNALETLLVHGEIAPRLLPSLAMRLAEASVELRGCPGTRALVPSASPATEADWDTEYLDLILAIRVVDDLDAAIEHIRRHGTGLAEAIVTNDLGHARRFTREVDAAVVLVNASTRLVDGGQFGMGAEMGISTSRVHARGPVGARELTTTKFVVVGDGQVRE